MSAIAYNNLSDSTAATIVASSNAPLMPASLLKDPHVERKWRGTAGTTEYLTIDLGSAKSIDTVMLAGLNLTAAGTTRVRISATDATATGSLLYDSTSAAGRVDPEYGYLIVLLTSPVTGRYIRIDLADASLSYIEAGRLAALLRTAFTYNFAPGWRWTYTDLSRKTISRGGQTYIDRNASYRTVELTFEFLTLAERNGIVEEIDRVNGEHSDILFISDTASTNLGRDSIWGLIDGNQPIVQPYVTDIYSKAYRIKERAARLLSPPEPIVALWTPADLGDDLVFWFDPHDAATITQSGGTVSQWNDKSTAPDKLSNATQATGANQPAYDANAFGSGLPGLVFDGSSDFLSLPSTSAKGWTAVEVFYVFRRDADPAVSAATSGPYLVANGGTQAQAEPYTDGSAYLATFTTVRKDGFAVTPDMSTAARITGMRSASGDWQHWMDGVQQHSTGTNTVALPANPRIGYSQSSEFDTWFDGKGGDIIGVNRTLTTLERQKVEGYLAHKYGVEANLPGGHPYASSPP